MGNWNITIRGVGCHHNKGREDDANRMAAEFVQKLIAAGHSISHASITFGGEDDITQPTMYLDNRNASEGREQGPRCCHPIGDKACRLVLGHESLAHLPPLEWEKH